MKVLAFNSSPRMKKGVTDKILQAFLKGVDSVTDIFWKIYLLFMLHSQPATDGGSPHESHRP